LPVAAKPSEHVAIDAQRDILLARRQHELGFGPVDIERRGIRILGDGFRNILVSHRVNARVIRLTFHSLRLLKRDARNTLFALGHWPFSR
jgi:hypothetical protein